jgi:hypothetical protein
MKSGIKKTMRVATTFTGAAATCAVGFNNAAAMAGTAGPAAAAQPDITANHRISGSIKESACGDHSHWMHVQGPESATCFGFKGILSLSPWPNMRAFCGGNNSGYIYGHDNLHSYTVYDHYGHGNTYYNLPSSVRWFYVSEVENTGWGGNDHCASREA